jgi:hypothetical protein
MELSETFKHEVEVSLEIDDHNKFGLVLRESFEKLEILDAQISILKKQVKDIKDVIETTNKCLAKGKMPVKTDCQYQYDFKKGTKRLIVLQSGEVYAEYPMTDEDKQMRLA